MTFDLWTIGVSLMLIASLVFSSGVLCVLTHGGLLVARHIFK